jgi:hypothetical protein
MSVNVPPLDFSKLPSATASDIGLAPPQPDVQDHVQITKAARLESNIKLAERLLAEYARLPWIRQCWAILTSYLCVLRNDQAISERGRAVFRV